TAYLVSGFTDNQLVISPKSERAPAMMTGRLSASKGPPIALDEQTGIRRGPVRPSYVSHHRSDWAAYAKKNIYVFDKTAA
ncbi:MAG: hypothetical protein ACP5JG_10575, partial [Anaerolineae bacterium]